MGGASSHASAREAEDAPDSVRSCSSNTHSDVSSQSSQDSDGSGSATPPTLSRASIDMSSTSWVVEPSNDRSQSSSPTEMAAMSATDDMLQRDLVSAAMRCHLTEASLVQGAAAVGCGSPPSKSRSLAAPKAGSKSPKRKRNRKRAA